MQTYNVKLSFTNPDEKSRLDKTLCLQKECWNLVSLKFFYEKPKGIKELHDCVYSLCRSEFPELPAQYVIRSYNDVKATYKTIKSNKHEIYKPAKKKTISVRLDKRLYSFHGNSIYISACNGKKIGLSFEPYKKLQEFLNIKTPCDPLIFERDGQLWLSLSFKSEKKLIKENKVLGVDIGEKRLFATSESEIFIDKKFNKERRELRYNKRKLKSKNTKSANKKLRKLKRKERNKSKNQIHKAVNQILNTQANTIALEDLKGIKKNISKKNKKKGSFGKKRNNKFSQIPLAEMRTVLIYKAGLSGKKVVLVDPKYTSQNDYRGIERGERKKTRYYASDGVILDSDVNAAINIAKRYADKHQLPVSFGKFKIPGLDGQAIVNWPNKTVYENGINVSKSLVQTRGITSPEALARGS